MTDRRESDAAGPAQIKGAVRGRRVAPRRTVHRGPRGGSRLSRGLTLVELMVALLLGGMIALAAMSSLVVARRGFGTVSAASQLRDNARFATDMVQRIIAQAGYLDVYEAAATRSGGANALGLAEPPPYTFGFDNAVLPTSASAVVPTPADSALNGTRNSALGGCTTSTDTACNNGSDILVLAYQTPATHVGGTKPDPSMVNCAGAPGVATAMTADSKDLAVSAFSVALSKGEPALMCAFRSQAGNWTPGTLPLVAGVETFQVLYGVDGVTPGMPTPSGPTPNFIADRYLRADELVVPANLAETNRNWRRVRSVRVGMVLRGPPGSAQDNDGGQILYPLGQDFARAADKGSIFTAPADGRLRQTVTFTVQLRNDQNL